MISARRARDADLDKAGLSGESGAIYRAARPHSRAYRAPSTSRRPGERRDPYTPPVRFVRDDETTRAQQGRCLWVPAFAGTTRGEGGCNHPTFRLLDTPLSRGMTKDDRTAH